MVLDVKISHFQTSALLIKHHVPLQNLLCGAVHKLRSCRVKPDHITVLSLLYLAKSHPEIFNRDKIIHNLAGLLNKETSNEYIKTKGMHFFYIF